MGAGMAEKAGKKRKTIVGVGSALVDILAHEDDAFLQKFDAVKGGMKLVEDEFIERLLGYISGRPTVVPGGSACNTVIGVGKLGGIGRFVGKRGKDELGSLFEDSLSSDNVEPVLFKSSLPTGRVLSIITPDAQRSMFTCLGAAGEMKKDEITESCFADAAVVHVEGYMVYDKVLIETVLKKAQEAGARVSLDLASFTVVEEYKDFFESIIAEYVDILIANEDEARIFTGLSDEEDAVGALAENVDIAVLKVGKKGSYISAEGSIIQVEPQGAGDVIDTTGAGDLWASGFLFGLVNGCSYDKCGEIGSACGYEVCRVIGASIPENGWDRIKTHL